MKIRRYSLGGPQIGLVKQNAIWVSGKNIGTYPLVYFQRPKWIKDDACWEKICKAVKLQLPVDFEVS